MSKHTPGKWEVEKGGARLIQTTACVISANDGLGPVAYATTINAQLIAASPDLIKALRIVSPLIPAMLNFAWINEKEAESIRAAIAKAEGKA
jgi:hypothetical protein